MLAIILDLETVAALTPETEAELRAGVAAPANYKDPEKIRAYVEAAAKKEIDKAALSPLTGRISLATVAVESRGGEWAKSQIEGAEPELIKSLLALLAKADVGHRVVTFNGGRFDLPYLAVRAMACGLSSPWPIPRAKDYTRHLDLYDALGGLGSLDRYARAILGRGKLADGLQAAQWAAEGDMRSVQEYASQEMDILIELYQAWRAVATGEETGS